MKEYSRIHYKDKYEYNRKWVEDNRERTKAVRNAWKKKNPEKVRDLYLKYRFGISSQTYQEMFLKQNGNCAMCGRNQEHLKKRLAVDHCHNTDAVRGLLCTPCNVGLGILESKEFIKNAKRYLEEYGQAIRIE